MESCEKEFVYYPILTDFELGEINQTISSCTESKTILTDRHFKELINQIKGKIRDRKETRKLESVQYGGIYQRSKVCWTEIIDIKKLRRILLDEKNEEKLV